MTDASMALVEYLRKAGGFENSDFLKEAVQRMAQAFIELELEQQIGAAKHERSADRLAYRNGYRPRVWETRVGEIPLEIPRLREGSFFPTLLEPRRRSEKALLAVVQQAYIQGVSTRKVDELLQALGLTGIDKSRVSRICSELDEHVKQFRERSLSETAYPYLWLDALYLKVRQNGRVVSMAVVIAIGVRDTGEREILGLDVGAAESEPFWLQFLRDLTARGLKGVQLVISDAHEGLKKAIAQALSGASWQRCRVHFMRNVLSYIPKGDKSMVAAAMRTIFAQPTQAAASAQLATVVAAMEKRWPKPAALVAAAESDILAYMAFPEDHWRRVYSTNPLERLNKEVKRRTNVVGIFPDTASVIRLVGSLLIEIDDEWQVGRRYFSRQSMRQLSEPETLLAEPQPAFPMAPVH